MKKSRRGRAGRAWEAKPRREERIDAGHRTRRVTPALPPTPARPKGCCGTAPSSALPLLGDGPASPASRRLEADAVARATRPLPDSFTASEIQGDTRVQDLGWRGVEAAEEGAVRVEGAAPRLAQQDQGSVLREAADGAPVLPSQVEALAAGADHGRPAGGFPLQQHPALRRQVVDERGRGVGIHHAHGSLRVHRLQARPGGEIDFTAVPGPREIFVEDVHAHREVPPSPRAVHYRDASRRGG